MSNSNVHSFRLTDKMEDNLQNCKKILSKLTDIPIDDLSDTATLNFVLNRIVKDYEEYL